MTTELARSMSPPPSPAQQTDSVPDIRLAGRADIPSIGGVFGAGFEDDPVLSWALRDPGRVAKLTTLFTFLLTADFVPPGTTWMCDGAGAAWRPPDAPPPGDDDVEAFLTDMATTGATPDDYERLATMGAAVDAAHPQEPHWYLGVIATTPDRRAQGLGSALMAASLQAVDASRMPAYLESSNPRNISLYERHGFEVTGRIDIDAADGVFMTAMWRPAR